MTLRPLPSAAASLVATTLAAAPASAFTLHVLHINDLHSRIESIGATDSTCPAADEAEGKCFGGVARLFTAINDLRSGIEQSGEAVIVLDAGDEFQGSLFFTTYSGQAEAEFMNRIGFDAMVFGNHEFDLGNEPLAEFIETVDFPVISGSVDVSGDNRLAGLAVDHVILDIGDERVAIIGATTEDTVEISSPGESLAFRDTGAYLAETAAALEAEGVTKIIALTHVGAPADLALAAEVPGIDLIVGGHSHTLFSNSDEKASYPYPMMVDGPGGAKVPVVSAGSYSKYLGHIELTFDEAGVVTAAVGDTILLDKAIEQDAGILARIEELRAPIEELMQRFVSTVAADIDGSRETCRAEECPMGNLVADAILERVQGQGVTIALQNGGGLRASIAGGDVTMGDVVAVLPFQNTLSTFNLPGSALVTALENGVSQVEEGGGRFPQVAGLRFTWDPSARPLEGRVKSVEVREGDAWVPLDPAKVYTVASNNFMRNGGDGYASLAEEATNAYDYGPSLEGVLADYLAARPGYAPYTDGRIAKVE